MEAYLNDPDNVVWVRAGQLLEDISDACVDGREDEPVVGTPGGDTALFANVVIAYGKAVGREFSDHEIKTIFRWYVNNFGSFYMHTDIHALHRLG